MVRFSTFVLFCVVAGVVTFCTGPWRKDQIAAPWGIVPRAQERPYSCGAAALRMVLEHYGQRFDEAHLRTALGSSAEHGTSHRRMIAFARSRGLHAEAEQNTPLEKLRRALQRLTPVIVALQAWGGGHYVVMYRAGQNTFHYFDPYDGQSHAISDADLRKQWHDTDENGDVVTQLALFFDKGESSPAMAIRPIR